MNTGLNQFEAVAIQGYDPVSYFVAQPTPGDSEITSTYAATTYHFVNAENKTKFDADPEKYLPQYSGFCATAVSEGYLFEIDPTNFNIQNGKLYLYYKSDLGDAKPDWDANPKNRQLNADANWVKGGLDKAA